ncbi:MAG: OprO/OprP family phosphate-selective porin [Salinivirgaceae bacterium]|nr:OprO/OprP family phosphate-selective porin [Salinivirgaceae bacterium]
MRKLIMAVALMVAAMCANAQVKVKSDAGDITIRFAGRTHIDAGTFLNDTTTLGDTRRGVGVNDTRFGFTASFDEKWTTKVELQFAKNSTISFRDVTMGYKINDAHSISVGNQFQPFGLKIAGTAYKFIEDASIDNVLCPARKLGALYTYSSDLLLLRAGLFSDASADQDGMNKGVSLSAKAIVRPILSDDQVLQFGVAPMYTRNKYNAVSMASKFPSTLGSSSLISITAADASNVNRIEAEALFISGKLYTEARFQSAFVNVAGSENNTTLSGAFAQASYILIGEKQNYNKSTALAANSGAKTLEVLARVDFVSLKEYESALEDAKEIKASQFDITLGVNYFFNKFINARLNYIYAKANDDHATVVNPVACDKGLHMIQGRLQFYF